VVAGNTTNWAYIDNLFSGNAKYNKILCFYQTDVATFSNSLVHTIARYMDTIWGVDAYSEPEDGSLGTPYSPAQWSNYVAYVNTARYVIDQAGYGRGRSPGVPQIRLLGPCDVNDWVDGVLSNLYCNFGRAFSNLDVIAAHDYFACPGNGCCKHGMCNADGLCTNYCPPNITDPASGTNAYSPCCLYVHPTDSPGPGYANLAGRIQNMQYWASVAGATNLVILEEYCLYSGDVNDARTTAQILGSNQNVAIVLSSPNNGMGTASSCPTANALSNATWDAAMTAFMNEACSQP